MSPAAKITSAFFLATAVASVGAGFTAVWIGDVDPKFRDSPEAALGLELTAGGMFAVIGTALVGIGAAILRKHLVAGRTEVLAAISWGVAYPILLRFCVARVVKTWDPESIAGFIVGWLHILGFPLLLNALLWKLRIQPKRNDQAGAL